MQQMPLNNKSIPITPVEGAIGYKEIAAVVVLYYPDATVLGNIYSYINQVDIVYAIDNTEQNHGQKSFGELHSDPKIVYMPNHENLGIAAALNLGACKAIQAGYNFLLTMDQDSMASPTMVADLTTCATRENLKEIGILSPFHSTATDPRPPDECFAQVLTAWTSGSLLNLAAYKDTGPFAEELFIDFVDHEYGLRLNLAGYKIFKVNKAKLTHSIGTDLRRHKFLWASPVTSNHSALRRYYITRNRFYIASRFKKAFPEFFRNDLVLFWKELIVIFLFETDVFHKYRMIFRGFRDYQKGLLGKYQNSRRQHS